MSLIAFLVAQLAFILIFYRVVIRRLPDRINDLIFEAHLNSRLAELADDAVAPIRTRLGDLEKERADAIVEYARVKGLKLNTTENERRRALRRSIDKLSRQIIVAHREVNRVYGSETMQMLEQFERIRLVTAFNALLDRWIERRN